MRTLRNALGPNINNLWNTRHDEIIQQLVQYYNTSYHNGIRMSPIEMHTNIDKEWRYMRKMTDKLNQVKKQQISNGLWKLRPGDKVMVHLDYGNSSMKFDKRRRQFDETVIFIRYVNGNCLIRMTETNVFSKPIEVPIFFVELLSNMDKQVHDTFNIKC